MSELDDISAPLAPVAPQVQAPVTSPLDEFSTPLRGSTAKARATVNANENPEDAGKALSISKQTGIPASIVQTDIHGYDAHAKTQAAAQAVQNPAIASYIDQNPMAAKVSNDDYKYLDEISQYFENLHADQIHAKASVGVFQAIPEIAQMLGSAPGRDKLYDALTKLPRALLEGLVAPFAVPGNVYSGNLDLSTPEGMDQAIGLGIGIAMGGAGNRGTIMTGRPEVPAGTVSFDEFMSKLNGLKTRQEIDDFIRSRSEETGTTLMIEKARVAGEDLDQAVAAVKDSKTHARSPDAYQEFVDQHPGAQGNVYVPGQTILDLYNSEKKVPQPADGLFGFVPGILQKAEAAAAAGAEVMIPKSAYLTNAEPFHDKIKDQVRVNDDGVTREEAKAAPEEEKITPSESGVEKSDNPVIQATTDRIIKEQRSLYLEPLFKDGKALNITQTEFKQYSDLNEKRAVNILTKAVAVERKDAAKRLTPEWKANEASERAAVQQEIELSPAYLADRFFNIDKGMLPNGKRILSDYWKPLGEVKADEWAPVFGFESGSEMVKAILEREAERADAGKGPKWQMKQQIDAETARRMEVKYGNLDENINLAASEAALADWNVDLLAAEWRILAKQNNTEPPLNRQQLNQWAKDQFEKATASQVSYEVLRRASEKSGRETEKAFLKGDVAEALIQKEHQLLAFLGAREAKKFENFRDGIEKKIDRFTRNQTIDSIDQEHLDQIRGLLNSLGVPQRYGPEPLDSLNQFMADSEGQIAMAPWLMEKDAPKIDEMTVDEYRAFADSLKSMEHVGRKTKTLENARGAAELQNVVFDAKNELERFNFIDQPQNPKLGQRANSLGRKIIGAHLLVERMFDYTDRFDPHGPITSYLDRPLRDSNVKELVLTEQVTKMLRDLRQHVDETLNDPIDNKLIPDKLDKTSFLNMTRSNLRQVMLNTGNWSNWKKMSEGFGINEADLRRFVDQNATAQDVAWVNGVWDIFAHLKPEADAMQLRDTGVAADTIPARNWSVAAGELKGGYYPIVYDKYNSNIQGHMAAKNPIFDNHYVQATTPHGYTEARTEYKGALDLSGSFLASRIQGMIHDIAFRESVRNANKLISNQEFRTAIAQRWGTEVSDLLPSWLKDIANSHTLDDNYAQGLTRVMALTRQNVISTLIAYNPGTYIKHLFTAAAMSMTQVGLGPLASATKELGFSGAFGAAKDIIKRSDRVPDEAYMDAFRTMLDEGERGMNARKFMLDSSAVMRNRQRQADDSIRGAVDRMNNFGWGQTLSNWRDNQMLLGRMMVAWSDGLSAGPTWYAAYQKAYLAGEEHADAVFIADKEVSRAHGSSFVGDQPLVTRIKNGPTGEIARWFVPLYKFWNHTVNNNFQLVWDMAAKLRGPNEGFEQEPGAAAWSITKRIGLVLATIFIEEAASAAKDEENKSFGMKFALASIRYFGGGIIGVRELTNGLAHGYEPSTGLIGTLGKQINNTVNDIKAEVGLKAQLSKNWITHTATIIGDLTGFGGAQVGKTLQGAVGQLQGTERPKTWNDYRQLYRTGSTKARVH